METAESKKILTLKEKMTILRVLLHNASTAM